MAWDVRERVRERVCSFGASGAVWSRVVLVDARPRAGVSVCVPFSALSCVQVWLAQSAIIAKQECFRAKKVKQCTPVLCFLFPAQGFRIVIKCGARVAGRGFLALAAAVAHDWRLPAFFRAAIPSVLEKLLMLRIEGCRGRIKTATKS